MRVPPRTTILGATTAVLAASITGCSTPAGGTTSTPSPPNSVVSLQSSTAVSATTEPLPPVNFPDLSGFTESIAQFDQVDVPRVQGFYFSTASGLICGSNAYPELQFEYVSCRGPILGQGPGIWEVRAGYAETATIQSIDGDPGFEADSQNPPAVLPPMHKVTATRGDAVCGVDDAGLVACEVADHGFVMTPAGTELF